MRKDQKNIHAVFDVEANGPTVLLHDPVSIGIVVLEPGYVRRFYVEMAAEHFAFDPEAYRAIGVTREQHLAYTTTKQVAAERLVAWAEGLGGRVTLWSDNPGWDFQWILALCWAHTGRCPFGHSARRIGDLALGLDNRVIGRQDWKKLRVTRHTHRADDDALGNAEALDILLRQKNIKAPWL